MAVEDERHSQRTYNAARRLILNDPGDPLGIGFTEQLIQESTKPKFRILGISLMALYHALRKDPKKLNKAREILEKKD